MKRLLLITMILAGVLFAQTGFSQVYIHANIGWAPKRIFCPPPPPRIVYEQPRPAPVPYYQGYAERRVIVAPACGYEARQYNGEHYSKRERYERYYRERNRKCW